MLCVEQAAEVGDRPCLRKPRFNVEGSPMLGVGQQKLTHAILYGVNSESFRELRTKEPPGC